MSRRNPPREYYEEEFEVEQERGRYPQPRRRELELDEDIEYRRRKSMPPVEDLERLHLRDRPPRDLVRESFAPPRDRGPMIRRGKDDLDEQFAGPNPDDPRVRPSRRRGSQSHRPREVIEEEESELIIGERERRGGRRHRRPRDLEEEDLVIRRERASDGDLRPREKVYEDEREEIYFRPSSRPPRRPSRREVEFEERIIDDRAPERPRGQRHRAEPTFEEELVMQWKDRPTSRELEEEEEIRLRETRRRRPPRHPESKYGRQPPPREPPGAWPVERDNVEEEIRIRERRRSRPRHREIDEEEDLVVRREERDRERGKDSAESDEIRSRKSKRRSQPREPSSSPEPIRAPPIHQDVITHHRHIDHGFDTARPPRAPSPEVASERSSFDEIDIRHRSKKGNRGRKSEEEIIFKRHDKEESLSPTSGPSLDFSDPWKSDRPPSRRTRKSRSLNDDDDSASSVAGSTDGPSRRGLSRSLEIEEDEIEEEIKIHKKSKHRSPIKKMAKETTDEWSVVHAPSKEEAVEMTGALEVVEVAPKGSVEDELEIQGRVKQQVVKERRDERWTEITKDLVVREAIERLGYEFEETRQFYYIFSFLKPADIDELVNLSDEIRYARRRRINEMQRERAEKPHRSISLVDRMAPRPRMVGKRHIREREWIVDERMR